VLAIVAMRATRRRTRSVARCWQAIAVIERVAVFNRHVATLDVARFAQAISECCYAEGTSLWKASSQNSDHWYRRLLRPRRRRPCRRAPKPCDELPPLHHDPSRQSGSLSRGRAHGNGWWREPLCPAEPRSPSGAGETGHAFP
jgi:hypothetical protein